MKNKTKCYCGHTDYCDCSPLEELKQETLEKIAIQKRKELGLKGTIDGFIAGAKWQQERMYSEEEVLEIIDLLFHRYASSFRIDAKEYFLQFKKK